MCVHTRQSYLCLTIVHPPCRWRLALHLMCTGVRVLCGSEDHISGCLSLLASAAVWNVLKSPQKISIFASQSYQTVKQVICKIKLYFFPCSDWDQFTIFCWQDGCLNSSVCASTFNFGFFRFKMWTCDFRICIMRFCIRGVYLFQKAFSLRASVTSRQQGQQFQLNVIKDTHLLTLKAWKS